MFRRLYNLNILNKRGFSCYYDKPLLFGPMFSSFFFSMIFSGINFNLITKSHITLMDKLNELKKDIKDIKNEK